MSNLMSLMVVLVISAVKGQVYDISEGSRCEWLNVTGTCVNVRRCSSFALDKIEGKYPPICSFKDKEPIICCTDCVILSVERENKDPLDWDKFKTDRKYERKCFEYQYLLPYKCKTHKMFYYKRSFNEMQNCYEFSITTVAPVGVEDAPRSDFPHMALLGYGPDLESAQWLCGGTLISDRFVLTAAHCASSTELGYVTYVALGMLKRSDPPQYWKRYKVKRFIPHPDYNPPTKYNDIALIETELRINFTEGVRPACLTHKPKLEGDNLAYATGWESLGKNKENVDVMQKVFLQKFTAKECAAQFPVHRHLPYGVNETTQICYGDHNAIKDSTCKGDSGGPLQKRDPKAQYCQYAVIGVTSYGRECGQPGAAGIYTRVYHYVPWIESIVWPY